MLFAFGVVSWRWAVAKVMTYDFYCWRPAAQFCRAIVFFKVMTKYGRPCTKERQFWWSSRRSHKMTSWEARCAVREAIKWNSDNRGLTNRIVSLISVWGMSTNFRSFKMCNSNFATVLPQLSLKTVSYCYYLCNVISEFRNSTVQAYAERDNSPHWKSVENDWGTLRKKENGKKTG